MKYLFPVLFIFILYGCASDSPYPGFKLSITKRDAAGRVIEKLYRGPKDSSICDAFNSNGIRTTQMMGIQHGNNLTGSVWVRSYFLNGKIKSEGKTTTDGRRTGWWTISDSSSGDKDYKEYVHIHDSSDGIVNRVIYANKNGDTIKENSFYYSKSVTADTIKMGDNWAFKVIMNAAPKKYCAMILGNYDDSFKIGTSRELNVYPFVNNELSLSPSKMHVGINYIRGEVVNFNDSVTAYSDPDNFKYNSKNVYKLYFVVDFYVKP